MAKTIKASITPEVLKWAREKRIRLSIEYVAEKLNVEPARLRTCFKKQEIALKHCGFVNPQRAALGNRG